MADQLMTRSGLCHGPGCRQSITESSPSEDFHDQDCQIRWNAAYAEAPQTTSDTAMAWLAEHVDYAPSAWQALTLARLFDDDEFAECTCPVMNNPPCGWCESGGPATDDGDEWTWLALDECVEALRPDPAPEFRRLYLNDVRQATFTPTGPPRFPARGVDG